MSVAIPYIAVDFHLSPVEMGVVMSVFFVGYSISQIPGGLLADIFGVREVGTIALLWWSAFTAITGLVTNLPQMLVTRFVFGLGEGMYPACVFKAVAVWFPIKERATANGIRLASAPLGSALSPLVVVGIMYSWGWRAAFYVLFFPGVLVSLLVWIFISTKPSESSRVSPEELAEIEGVDVATAQSPKTKVTFFKVIFEPNVLKYFFVLLFYDIAFWGFTAWLPTYLVKARGFSMTHMGVLASLPFFAATISSISGGWVSDRYFSNNRLRPLVPMLLIAAFLLYLTFTSDSTTMLVICETLGAFFLTLFYTSFWALPMNTVPKEVMGLASGFINLSAGIAAAISPIAVGYLVGAAHGNYALSFIFMIVSLLVSCMIIFTIPSKLKHRQES